MNLLVKLSVATMLLAGLVACVNPDLSASPDMAQRTQAVLQSSFATNGIASIDRLQQDEEQKICSAYQDKSIPEDIAKNLEQTQLRLIPAPPSALSGSWQEGEKIAQSGRGLTFSDKAGDSAGGNCYACHQLSKQEISFGNIGPSLYQYGKLRGQSVDVLAYTYRKIYNAHAYRACSAMPRFGQQKILTEQQIMDVVALLLDPASPVNQ